MNTHTAQCKFCKRDLVLQCDPDYNTVSDPQKLVPMITCNRCAQLRIRRRQLEERIQRVVGKWKETRDSDVRSAIRVKLTELTSAYCNLIAEWLNATQAFWSRDIVDLICDKPDHWPKVLGQCWKMYQDKAA